MTSDVVAAVDGCDFVAYELKIEDEVGNEEHVVFLDGIFNGFAFAGEEKEVDEKDTDGAIVFDACDVWCGGKSGGCNENVLTRKLNESSEDDKLLLLLAQLVSTLVEFRKITSLSSSIDEYLLNPVCPVELGTS